MPAAKKDPSVRRRTNKASTAATLTVAEPVDTSAWTVKALRFYLRERGLPVSGDKLTLRARVEQVQSWDPGFAGAPAGVA